MWPNFASMARMASRKWSQKVTETSDALTLEDKVFTKKDPRAIARSLKRSADSSRKRKSTPYSSAMSMLTFYINRAGEGLSATERKRLDKAKDELRDLYGKQKSGAKKSTSKKPRSSSSKKSSTTKKSRKKK